mgnify:CR=1 FL=1
MTKVVSLTGNVSALAQEPQPQVIEALEKLLDEAKSGRIQHIAAVYTDGAAMPMDIYAGTGEPDHVLRLVGSMELCKHTMLMGMFQETTSYSG